ncbi:MAG: isochorismatase family cysteine hydrolase [Bacteroidota bacterium]|nr:isochorismatase family cysteine hydrolase [Bacteroidota bacterium]
MEQSNKQNKALLVMDVQGGIINRLENSFHLINSINKAIQTARRNKMPVIFVVVGFRKGHPEASPDNKSFSMLKSGLMNSLDTEEAVQIHASVDLQPADIVITKKRTSAFTGSDMEVVLRSIGIKHLVLTGISTSGVVLSTLREAADKDYVLTVLSDCCADRDDEVHRVLITKIFPRQAEVITAEEWYALSRNNDSQ